MNPGANGTDERCGSETEQAEELLLRQQSRRAGSRRNRGPDAVGRYLPARRCQRVAFSIFLCFFLRMRLRRFLISDPMAERRVAGRAPRGRTRHLDRELLARAVKSCLTSELCSLE